MTADLDHTIVHVRNRQAAAAHVVEMLDLDPAVDYGPFAMVRLGNQAVLAFADTLGRPRAEHFAFLVTPAEFDQIRQRLADQGITTYADPGHQEEGVDEARDEGGRGLYWDDPDGNALEILTVPDGGWPAGHPRRPS
jgi:catechol 2,3-dioxygenase-like lactoylglutathione lyase family enzyme